MSGCFADFWTCLSWLRQRADRSLSSPSSVLATCPWAPVVIIFTDTSGLCCCSMAESCWTLHDPMDCSTPGFPVLHCLPELAQTHIHWVSDAIQPPCLWSSPSPPALNPFQHQSLFQWVHSASGGQSIGGLASVSVLPMIIQGWFPLGWTGLSSLQSKKFWRVFSSTTIQKHQFLRLLFGPTLTSIHEY